MTSHTLTTAEPAPAVPAGEIVSRLLHTLGDPDPARGAEDITVVGADPLVPSVHRLADAMSAAIGVFGRQTAAVGEQRGHPHQRVEVPAGAAIDQLMATYHTTLSGRPLGALLDDPALLGNNDFYRAQGGRWIFIITTYPHLRDAVCSVLGCGPDKVGIARAAMPAGTPSRWRRPSARAAASPARCAAGTSGSHTPPGGTWHGARSSRSNASVTDRPGLWSRSARPTRHSRACGCSISPMSSQAPSGRGSSPSSAPTYCTCRVPTAPTRSR
ncbi:hypothetical protein ACQ4WX_24970 [Streptomyces lasalocidi]